MFLVGLTGGIATGKSTVSDYIRTQSYHVIDADVIARAVVEPGKPAWKQIKAHFGTEVINEDGSLNRARLGQIIFSDGQQRKKLNAITHPAIYKSMMWQAFGCMLRGSQFAVLDLPLLFESGTMLPVISYTVVVKCSKENQIQRLMARNNFSEEEAQKRIDAQMSLDVKCDKANYVIDNDGSIEQTKRQVDDVLKQIRASKKHLVFRFSILAISYFVYTTVCVTFGVRSWLIIPHTDRIMNGIRNIGSAISRALPF